MHPRIEDDSHDDKSNGHHTLMKPLVIK